jgi:hypothetical protein
MKWQKNTGVMPTLDNPLVEVIHVSGAHRAGTSMAQDWSLHANDPIMYWCRIVSPPFDYVEPKVWTVEVDDFGTAVLRNGKKLFRITYVHAEYSEDYLIDALNAMEERYGTK